MGNIVIYEILSRTHYIKKKKFNSAWIAIQSFLIIKCSTFSKLADSLIFQVNWLQFETKIQHASAKSNRRLFSLLWWFKHWIDFILLIRDGTVIRVTNHIGVTRLQLVNYISRFVICVISKYYWMAFCYIIWILLIIINMTDQKFFEDTTVVESECH